MATDDDCSVCLQILFDPILTACGHSFCYKCWDRLAATAKAELSRPRCPACRTECTESPPRDAVRDALVREHQPVEWHRRRELALADARGALRIVQGAERDKAEAESEILEADEQRSPDGRRTIRMSAGLLRRQAKEQSTYRTITLIAKLELTLCGLRDISPAIQEYAHLTSLRLEHNVIQSLEHLVLPQLRILSVHHNKLSELGDALSALPQLLSLDVSANLLSSLEGVQHCTQLATLQAAHNQLADAAGLAPLARCAALSTLDLPANRLAHLTDLAPIAAVTSLRSLKLGDNPLSAEHSRSAVLAALPQVRLLDLQPISPKLTPISPDLRRRCAYSTARRMRRSSATSASPPPPNAKRARIVRTPP